MSYKGYHIYQRKTDKYWYARVLINNKYTYVYDKTQKVCYKKLKNLVDSIKTEKTIYNYHNLKSWINQWILVYKKNNVKESTLKQINGIIKTHLTPLFELNIKTITSLQILKLLNQITAKRQKEKTFVILKDIFERAKENNIIQFNPVAPLTKPKYEKEKESLALNNEQEILIENYLLNKNEFALLFCLYQGTRIGETLALNWNDISNNSITINKSKNKDNIITSPKSKTSNRTIPLFEKTKLLLTKINHINENIFNDAYDNIQNRFMKIRKELNLTQFTIHSLRHTFATRCLEKGVEIKTISKWLGHYNTDITSRIYLHINKDFETKEIEKINNN